MNPRGELQRSGHKLFGPANLRAAERVIQYLAAEFENPELKNGSRLPTHRELARRLKVSVPTVRGALRQLSHQGRIRTRTGSGTYLVSKSPPQRDELRIAVGMPLDFTTDLWMAPIGGGMLQAVLCALRPITLVGLSSKEWLTEAAKQKLLAERDQMAGVVLFPQAFDAGGDEEVTSAYERVGKPVVHLNPPTVAATANFVSADFFGASRLLGRAWRKTGRRRVWLLVGPRLKESVSGQLRHAGLVNGLRAGLGDSGAVQVRDDISHGEGPAYEATRKVLEGSPTPPDAVYCTGDFTALAVIRALQERGLRIPQDVSVVGGTGLDLSGRSWPELTRMRQPLPDLGLQLVEMLCKRIEQHGAPLPGLFLPTPFIGGATTRPEENEFLNLARLRENEFAGNKET